MTQESPAQYAKRYRWFIGFTNQNEAKRYLSGKDIQPGIDYGYIDDLNRRIEDIVKELNKVITPSFRLDRIDSFCQESIHNPYEIIRNSKLIQRLNNQGRRPEQVLFSWLRGYAVVEYFTPVFEHIFDIKKASIYKIGEDDLRDIDSFKRTPTADLEFQKDGSIVRLEIQSGFQGINDIKEHKVREAKKLALDSGCKTVCVHLDLFNGQVAFVRLDTIENNSLHWVTRQQMEGQTVFSIDQNNFIWRIMEEPPSLNDMEID
ncbi:MAG: restriction endonuclease [Pseudomonadota bacterium]